MVLDALRHCVEIFYGKRDNDYNGRPSDKSLKRNLTYLTESNPVFAFGGRTDGIDRKIVLYKNVKFQTAGLSSVDMTGKTFANRSETLI